MAQKKIGDLQLRSSFDDTCSVPVDDATQTWRATGAQILSYIGAAAGLITARTFDTDPQSVDSLLTYDSSATALKKVTKADLLKEQVTASKTTTYTATAEDSLIMVSGASAAWTLALPTAVGIGGKKYKITRTDNTLANAVTVDANGSETIGGALTFKLYTKESVTIVSDGANWQIAGRWIDSRWVTFSMVFAGSGTTPVAGTVVRNNAYWRRNGDSIDIRYSFQQSSTGTTGTGVMLFTLPSGLSIDTAKVALDTAGNVVVGQGYNGSGGNALSTTSEPSIVVPYDSTHLAVLQGVNPYVFLGTSNSFLGGNANAWLAFAASVPISGWEG